MILYTLVYKRIPADQNWSYFEPPVKCYFHTNKSMSILMDQWGYISSIYFSVAKIWIFFKKESDNFIKVSLVKCIFLKRNILL